MKVSWIFLVFVLLMSGISCAEIIDARNSNEWQKLQTKQQLKLSSWPVFRIEQLEKLQGKLRQDISTLPRHCPIISDNHLGYHSSLNINNGEKSPALHQIDFTLARPSSVQSIALVPAFNPLRPYGGSYAFPKRFKLEVQMLGQNHFEEIVNWMDEDFPNPGAYPVFFNDIDKKITLLRLTAASDTETSAKAHFALGEVFIWAEDEANGLIENVARAAGTQVVASSSYNQSAKWHIDYLTDLDTGLGFPIQEQELKQPDLLIIPSLDNALNEMVELTIDLTAPKNISRLDFWPAKPSSNVMLPDFGFPQRIIVEVADNAKFIGAKIVTPDSKGEKFGTLFSVRIKPEKFQYIRIRVSQLQEINKKRILGLGEIAIYDAAGQLVHDANIVAKGIPEHYLNQLPRLLDGYSWGRSIVPEREWMMGLAKRRPLDQQLKHVESELALAHEYWDWLLSRLITGSVIVVLLLFITGVILFQRYQRQHLLIKQGQRINRDLHDEVGSSLGSITLLADELAEIRGSSAIADDLNDLSLMAREANASLREVVWNGSGNSVLLMVLLQSLFERAERVLRGVTLSQTLPENCPDIKVSLTVKRQLTMFFKEVIHNCARHANATKFSLSAAVDDNFLSIEISDNGCGFESSQTMQGWGLKNLAARAEELSGEIKIDSQLTKGTTVTLRVSLAMLSKEPELSYQTSNE
ncbi:MAG: sensor histidine kinase [Thalassotalea sp.]